jgi:predicted metal-dependent phosphoesterase TrpH
MSGARRFEGPIDLHTHSRVSDGTQSPRELMFDAAASGIRTVALTDHDSTAGWAEAAEAAAEAGITLIRGMEFSTRVRGTSVHLLAYLFDPDDAGIVAETARIRDARFGRAQRMVERIGADYPLTWDDVLAQAQDGSTIGRPHIADALVERGHAATRTEAFGGILHWRAGYYEPHYAPEPMEAVRLVTAAGGVPVLAHPATRGVGDIVSEERLAQLVEAGLFGLELDHRENKPEPRARLETMAKRYGLAVTGSSDYHGAGKVNRLGENTTTPDVLDRLIERASGVEPLYA